MDKPEIYYEVWQSDCNVAGSNDLKEACRYALMYAEDGPVKLFKVTSEQINIQALIEESGNGESWPE